MRTTPRGGDFRTDSGCSWTRGGGPALFPCGKFIPLSSGNSLLSVDLKWRTRTHGPRARDSAATRDVDGTCTTATRTRRGAAT